MIILFLALLLVIDLGLFLALYFFYRKNIAYEDLLTDLNEERILLGKMHEEIRELAHTFDLKANSSLEKVTRIAAEIEQEVAHSSTALVASLDSVLEDVSKKFAPILKSASDQQTTLELTCRKADKEKLLLQKLLGRIESLSQFFNDKLPYDEVLKSIETKKYDDARHLLTQGYSIDHISKELGISKGEVDLIYSMNR